MSESFIDIKIDPDGTIHLSMDGYHGTGCDIDFKKINKILGSPSSSSNKPEYYEDTKEKIQE